MAKGGCDMKMRRPVRARVVLSLLVAMLGGLLGGTSALADSSVAIAISGTVDGSPESVYVSGLAQITSTLVKTDPKFNHPPRVILSFDLHNVSGKGLSTGAMYVTKTQDDMLSVLAPSDVVAITLPFYPNTAVAFRWAR